MSDCCGRLPGIGEPLSSLPAWIDSVIASNKKIANAERARPLPAAIPSSVSLEKVRPICPSKGIPEKPSSQT